MPQDSPQPKSTACRFARRGTVAALATLTLAACTSGGPDATDDPQSDPPENVAQCGADPDVLTTVDEGWSVTRDDDAGHSVSYAAVFESEPDVVVTSARVDVRLLDADGESLLLGQDADAQQATLLVSGGTTSALSDWALASAEPEQVEFTVTEACWLPADKAEGGVVQVSRADLTVPDGETAELAVEVESTVEHAVDVDMAVVFKDAQGEIIGGTIPSDGDVSLSGVATGTSESTASFRWESFYPDPADVASVEAYLMSLT